MRAETSADVAVAQQRHREADAWFDSHRAFFLLGLGRSGTKFLAELLGRSPGAAVFHEPIEEDVAAFVETHQSADAALAYVRNVRKRRMYELVADREVGVYGEANSWLRFCSSALRSSLPNVTILHLVRDGRDVVRSIMGLEHYTDRAPNSAAVLKPVADDPLHAEWDRLTRFEKVCWLWADANRRLTTAADGVVRFEEMLSRYDYFRDSLEKPLDLQIGEPLWSEAASKPVNAIHAFNFPHWREWSPPLVGAFERICASEMARLGYR